MAKRDPVTLEVFRNLFFSVADEMGVALRNTAFSPNIKERRDYSCAVFDAQGHTIAQGEHMPVHLGSMPMSVAAAIRSHELLPGDMVALNDPFRGGTHLPDITLVSPVFINQKDPSFFVANRAHHSDVGGMTPGSMPLSRSIFQEGIRIPPVKLVREGKIQDDVMAMILANVRTPDERSGDLTAQMASNRVGEKRIRSLVDRYGPDEVAEYGAHLQDYAEEMTRGAIKALPDGTYQFSDQMDDDGLGTGPVTLRVTITIAGDRAVVDFTGTDPQVDGSINAIHAITLSAVVYCFRLIVPYPIPANHGITRPIELVAPEGSLVNALPPAAVAGGNVETSQRIVDTVLGALAGAAPETIPAASSGTMNNLTIGGVDSRTGSQYTYYETIAGGMGARPTADGIDGIHTHMTNSLNTPIEALEHAYPFHVIRYQIRRGSGGSGLYRGGDGVVREMSTTSNATLTILSDRREIGPWGLAGGKPGAPGRNSLITSDGTTPLPSKTTVELKAGDVISIETPGGGGYGV